MSTGVRIAGMVALVMTECVSGGTMHAEQSSLVLSVSKTGAVSGQVVDDLTGRGVPLARVRVRVAGVGLIAEAISDARGGFTVTDLPVRRVVIDAERLGYWMPGADASARVSIQPGRTVARVVLMLRREVLGHEFDGALAPLLDLSRVLFPDEPPPRPVPLELTE